MPGACGNSSWVRKVSRTFCCPSSSPNMACRIPQVQEQAPDAILVAKDGYAVASTVEGNEFVVANTVAKTSLGSHGFLSTAPKMNALCVLSGNGIPHGEKLTDVENIDIAPTMAELFGLKDFPADGKPLVPIK